jgi:hypothetical protein
MLPLAVIKPLAKLLKVVDAAGGGVVGELQETKNRTRADTRTGRRKRFMENLRKQGAENMRTLIGTSAYGDAGRRAIRARLSRHG